MSAQPTREVDASAWTPSGGRARRCEECGGHIPPSFERVGGRHGCENCRDRMGLVEGSAKPGDLS